MIGKDGPALFSASRAKKHILNIMPVKNIVAQDEAAGLLCDEALADEKGLSQTAWLVLGGIADFKAPFRPVPQEALKQGAVVAGRNDQDVSYVRHHQGRERVIDHRLVIDRQQLLADDLRGRIKTSAQAACENYSLHEGLSPFKISKVSLRSTRQSPERTPKASSMRRQSRTELPGRGAAVG
jgi:hypothetical protein